MEELWEGPVPAKISRLLLHEAARAGHVKLISLFSPPKLSNSEINEMATAAASGGHVDITTKFANMLPADTAIPWKSYAFCAGANGFVEATLEFLRLHNEERLDDPWDQSNEIVSGLLRSGCHGKSQELITIALSNGASPYSEKLDKAAFFGDYECVKLISVTHPVYFDDEKYLLMASIGVTFDLQVSSPPHPPLFFIPTH